MTIMLVVIIIVNNRNINDVNNDCKYVNNNSNNCYNYLYFDRIYNSYYYYY